MNVRRMVVAVATVGMATLLVVPPAHAEGPDDELTGYLGSASGAVFTVQPVFPGLLPTGDSPFEVTGGLTSANVQSGGTSFSRAEAVWPGDGAANIGPLAAQGANQPIFYQLPAYPLGVQANQDSDTVSQGVAPGPVVKAVGKAGSSQATVTAGGGGIVGVFQFGSVTSTSTSSVVNGELVSEAKVVLHNVVLGAGTVTMDAVTSTSRATSKGASSASKGSTDVSGLKVNGQGASIDSKGLEGAGPVVDAMKKALHGAGIELTVVDGAGKASGGTADRLSAGVLVTIANPAAAAHPQFSGSRFVIALAPTAAGALASPPFDSAGVADTPPGAVDSGGGGFGSISSSVSDVFGTPTSTASHVSSGGGSHGVAAAFGEISDSLPSVGGISGGFALVLALAVVYGSRWVRRFAARFVSTEE